MEVLKVLFHVPYACHFIACLRQVDNLLATIKDDPYDIRVLINAEVIRSGIRALVAWQREGFIYLRP